MNITLLVIGKIKESFLKDGVNEYLKRLSQYTKVDIIELPDEPIPDNPSQGEILRAITKEGDKLLSHISSSDHVITLDLNKKEYTSPDFASYLQKKIDTFGNRIVFVIGGSYGLSDGIKSRANDSFSLGKMTFTHQMTRVLLLEQIYRAFKINNHETYHK
ncbi:MAG: 23S rRNA (pseudouridine(1915)-N(3))-methyltransferase RlmH [Bacilli bacterium]|nr:23S rRNA (pseudouridine(1915)-N(3))-methyltransferase RlmH [Bacilli bacterium]